MMTSLNDDDIKTRVIDTARHSAGNDEKIIAALGKDIKRFELQKSLAL